MGLSVLSLFDGIAGAKLALESLNIPIDRYIASEIDEDAIKVVGSCFPNNTTQVGDIRWLIKENLPPIDLLIGGSPCQGFSRSGKGLNFEDPRSSLVNEYARLLKSLQPEYFLLENVASMKKSWADQISEMVGVEPIKLNSDRFSAQSRERLYWTNIHVNIEDYNSIIKPTYTFGDVREFNPNNFDTYYFANDMIEKIPYLEEKYNKEFKLLTNSSIVPTISTKYTLARERFYGIEERGRIRTLSRVERERLQGFPTNYTWSVPKTTSFRLTGNAFNVPTIAFILKYMQW